MGRGDLVPDELTVSLVRERLGAPDAAKGYILDGFPAPSPRPRRLAGFQKLDAVVNFVIGDEVVVLRLTGREVCRSCGPSTTCGTCPRR